MVLIDVSCSELEHFPRHFLLSFSVVVPLMLSSTWID